MFDIVAFPQLNSCISDDGVAPFSSHTRMWSLASSVRTARFLFSARANNLRLQCTFLHLALGRNVVRVSSGPATCHCIWVASSVQNPSNANQVHSVLKTKSISSWLAQLRLIGFCSSCLVFHSVIVYVFCFLDYWSLKFERFLVYFTRKNHCSRQGLVGFVV